MKRRLAIRSCSRSNPVIFNICRICGGLWLPIRSSSPCRGGWALNKEGALIDIRRKMRDKKI